MRLDYQTTLTALSSKETRALFDDDVNSKKAIHDPAERGNTVPKIVFHEYAEQRNTCDVRLFSIFAFLLSQIFTLMSHIDVLTGDVSHFDVRSSVTGTHPKIACLHISRR